MKKLFSLFLLIIATSFLFAKSNNKNQTQAFAFESVDLDGKEITSELYSNNKLTMINIWGTFCGPCIREMPGLAKLSEENKAKGVEIIGIPIDIIDDWGKLDKSLKADALINTGIYLS